MRTTHRRTHLEDTRVIAKLHKVRSTLLDDAQDLIPRDHGYIFRAQVQRPVHMHRAEGLRLCQDRS